MSKETARLIRQRIEKYSKEYDPEDDDDEHEQVSVLDGILSFEHHKSMQHLSASKIAGCQLCTLIWNLYGSTLTTKFEPGCPSDMDGCIFHVIPYGPPAGLYYGSNTQMIALEVYSTDYSSESVWENSSHRYTHPLVDASKKTFKGLVSDCVHEHRVCHIQDTYLPTRLLNVSPTTDSVDIVLVETNTLGLWWLRQTGSKAEAVRYATYGLASIWVGRKAANTWRAYGKMNYQGRYVGTQLLVRHEMRKLPRTEHRAGRGLRI